MKEMEYSQKEKREVLATGDCFGIKYYILNLGTHPTAYIKIPDNLNIDEDKLEVHGGITYSDNHLWISEKQKIEGKFIGWDYAHYGDYYENEGMFLKKLMKYEKKWTTEEIYTEVENVCRQISNSCKTV